MTGIAQSTLSNYKRGKNDAKCASTLEKLADGLDMPLRLRQALGLTAGASRTGRHPAPGPTGPSCASTGGPGGCWTSTSCARR